MLRDGIHGIEDIPDTGQIFIEGIPIGVDTAKVMFMTGDFMKGTIVAMGEVGMEDILVVHLSARIDDAHVLNLMYAQVLAHVLDPMYAQVLAQVLDPMSGALVDLLKNLKELVMVPVNLKELANVRVRKDMGISHVRWESRPLHIW